MSCKLHHSPVTPPQVRDSVTYILPLCARGAACEGLSGYIEGSRAGEQGKTEHVAAAQAVLAGLEQCVSIATRPSPPSQDLSGEGRGELMGIRRCSSADSTPRGDAREQDGDCNQEQLEQLVRLLASDRFSERHDGAQHLFLLHLRTPSPASDLAPQTLPSPPSSSFAHTGQCEVCERNRREWEAARGASQGAITDTSTDSSTDASTDASMDASISMGDAPDLEAQDQTPATTDFMRDQGESRCSQRRLHETVARVGACVLEQELALLECDARVALGLVEVTRMLAVHYKMLWAGAGTEMDSFDREMLAVDILLLVTHRLQVLQASALHTHRGPYKALPSCPPLSLCLPAPPPLSHA